MVRFLDLFFAVICGIVFIPFILLIALILYILQGSPVLFIQTRVGLDGKKFSLLKLRTMYKHNNADNSYTLERSDVHPFGAFLRMTSLDEIPQIFNIITGDMSFVGPRPLPPELLSHLPKESQKKRSSLRPGLLGYAQFKYNGMIRSVDEKIDDDLNLVSNFSVSTYLRILSFAPVIIVKKILLQIKW